jgi:hypothetical protein
VRGQLVSVAVRLLDGDRFALIAGEHRLARARELGWSMIAPVIIDRPRAPAATERRERGAYNADAATYRRTEQRLRRVPAPLALLPEALA